MDGRKRRRSEDEVDLDQPPTCVLNTAHTSTYVHPSERTRSIVKRQRIVSYSELLKLGDVVYVWRPLGYKHYGIVSEVGHNYVLIIHYWAFGSKTLACIRQDPIEQFLGKEDSKLHILDFSTRLVRMMYGAPLEAGEVLAKARSKLGKKGGKYHLFENNCEHFAIKCKTGKSLCWQSLKYKVAGGILLLSSLVYP